MVFRNAEQRKVFFAKRNAVYTKYKNATNMGAGELKKWSDNPCSEKASLSREPITANLGLLKKKKKDWTPRDVQRANKTISYLARAKKIKSKNKVPSCGQLTKNSIALRNWGFDDKK